MAKAIKITEENKNRLIQQFDLEDDQLDEMVGLNLVADFGDSGAIEAFLTDDSLDKYYHKTGKKLQNGYFEVELRSPGMV